MLCKHCDSDNDSNPLWLGEYCQLCWERYSSGTWWAMVSALSREIGKIEQEMKVLSGEANP